MAYPSPNVSNASPGGPNVSTVPTPTAILNGSSGSSGTLIVTLANLPTQPQATGSGILWNDGGVVSVS